MKWIAAVVLFSIGILPARSQVLQPSGGGPTQWMLQGNITLGKHTKARNVGFSYVTVGLGGTQQQGPLWYPNRSQAIVIDVQALRIPNQRFSYRQLAERAYGIGPGFTPMFPQRVPLFLLMEPPVITPSGVPAVKVRY